MASWPAQADYRDALQNPDAVFRSAGLRQCRVETNKMRVPRARSGAFASVYKLEGPGGTVALKLFNFACSDRERRYRAIEEYVRKLSASNTRPSCLVPCRYEPQGIRINQSWYPIQTMDWVKGLSLAEWLRGAMRRKNFAGVRAMANAWVELVSQLQSARIAHGDLQHDNVMVVNDTPVLVDYDGMCVPGLEGVDQLEFGKPAYQHPARQEQKLGLGLDHFSAWTILISLRAVAFDPRLYERFVTAVDNEALLFREEDLRAPVKSELWPVLLKFGDAEVAAWSRHLRAAIDKPFAAIPPFTMDPLRTLRGLVDGKSRDWSAIAAEADRLSAAGQGTLPAEVTVVANAARQRVTARDQLKQALAAGDLPRIAAAYRPELLDDWPEVQPLSQQARNLREQSAILDKLTAGMRSPGDGRELVAMWDKANGALRGVQAAEPIRVQAELWRARLQAADRFATLATNPAADEVALADAWSALARVGSHPSITDDLRKRGAKAAHRQDALRYLRALPATPDETSDRKLVQVLSDPALKGLPAIEPFHERLAPARERLAILSRIAVAVRAADADGDEQAIVLAAASLTDDYKHALAERVQLARDTVRLKDRLNGLLAAEPQSDIRIAEVWEQSSAAANRVAPAVYERCELAFRRRDALRELERIAGDEQSMERQDRDLVRVWKSHAALLKSCPDAAPIRPRVQLALQRFTAWQSLKLSLDTHDFAAVKRLAADPDLAGYPPVVRHQTVIDDHVASAEQFERVSQRLAGSHRFTADDLKFIRKNHAHFDDEIKDRIRRAVEEQIKSGPCLKPGQPAIQLIDGEPAKVRVNWIWADRGLLSCCHVAHDSKGHLRKSSDADPKALRECRPKGRNRAGSFSFVPPTECPRVFVTIWPIVELGWATVTGPPMHIGPLALDGGRGWFRWRRVRMK
jgi:hypothetical protein